MGEYNLEISLGPGLPAIVSAGLTDGEELCHNAGVGKPIASALGCVAVLLCAGPVFAQKNLRIASVSYDQHANPAEQISFTIIVKNNETTTEFAEVDVTTVNVATRAEATLTPVLTANIAAQSTGTLSGSYTLAAGSYTVSFPLFDGNGTRVDRVQGKFPLHIGTETESIAVFPEVIHLGSIPPGRFMHPTPIEVSWSFFRFNRLRLDQPFVVRIYTDNAARYHGVPGSLHRISPAGLVSLDGRYVIPMKIWNLNYGPDIQETGWDAALAGPPPVEDDNAWIGPPLLEGGRHTDGTSWVRVKDRLDVAAAPFGWSRGDGMIGQDPHDNRYATDKNPIGEFTLTSPFTFYLATEGGPTAVEGSYAATLIVELWSP